MFEKIKEYQFVLIIGIALAAALVFFILRYNTTKIGSSLVTWVQNSVINSISKSDNYKKDHTIWDKIIEDLSWKSLGQYNIQTSSWVLYLNNYTWDVIVSDGTSKIDFPTPKNKNIFPIILPAQPIWTISWNDLWFLKAKQYDDKNWTFVKSGSDLTSSQKWYLIDLYFGFWPFTSKAAATNIQKAYLSSSNVVQGSGNNQWAIFQKISQQ